jgi:hypothetical protein
MSCQSTARCFAPRCAPRRSLRVHHHQPPRFSRRRSAYRRIVQTRSAQMLDTVRTRHHEHAGNTLALCRRRGIVNRLPSPSTACHRHHPASRRATQPASRLSQLLHTRPVRRIASIPAQPPPAARPPGGCRPVRLPELLSAAPTRPAAQHRSPGRQQTRARDGSCSVANVALGQTLTCRRANWRSRRRRTTAYEMH